MCLDKIEFRWNAGVMSEEYQWLTSGLPGAGCDELQLPAGVVELLQGSEKFKILFF